MPAKTVVFTNVRKFDGDKFRWLSSGEYIQMSGRAGRRGIDDRGVCILMVDEKLEPSTAKMMLKGSADSLNSAFHLSYNMLLNQMRCEDGDLENLLRNSFFQFQADRALPDLEKQAKVLEEERNSMVIEEEENLKNYYDLIQQYKSLKKDVRDIVFSPKHCLSYLQSGRLVCIQCTESDDKSPSFLIEDLVTWGVIVNFDRVKGVSDDDAIRKPENANYTVDVLTRCVVTKDGVAKKKIKVLPLKEPGEPLIVSIPIDQINILSSARLYMSKDLLPLEVRENTLKQVSEFLSRKPSGLPLDPEGDMNIQSSSYKKAVRRIEALEHLFEKHEIAKSPLIKEKLKVLHTKQELTARIKLIRKKMSQGSAYQTRQGQGSNTTSGDYHDYISRLSKMPSIIHGAPQYPSVHKAFNNKVTREEEVNEARQDNVNKKNPTRSTKKVRVKEQVQVIDQNGNRKPEDIEEDVDDEADGFIKQKKRGFELSKWKTFKYP